MKAYGIIRIPTSKNNSSRINQIGVNYEHKQDAEYVIGQPTDNCYVDSEKGLFVEALLYSNKKWAKDIWDLAQSIRKVGSNRKLGFSIEGTVRKRNDNDKRIIEELVIRNVAITKSPANPEATWDVFMKSLETGHEINPTEQRDGAVLRRESLGRAITELTYAYNVEDPKELDELWQGASEYLAEERIDSEVAGTILLQLSRGISRKEAEEFIQNAKTLKGD